ncbi:MAG: hypothetical protein HQ538_06240 [Parcubacteria group bacterium]|nr:hypothetical protein [Parcubacteria group bacterium]
MLKNSVAKKWRVSEMVAGWKPVIYVCKKEDCGKMVGCVTSPQAAFNFCSECTVECEIRSRQGDAQDRLLANLVEQGVYKKNISDELCEDCDILE